MSVELKINDTLHEDLQGVSMSDITRQYLSREKCSDQMEQRTMRPNLGIARCRKYETPIEFLLIRVKPATPLVPAPRYLRCITI
jgi:hypothetical protein